MGRRRLEQTFCDRSRFALQRLNGGGGLRAGHGLKRESGEVRAARGSKLSKVYFPPPCPTSKLNLSPSPRRILHNLAANEPP